MTVGDPSSPQSDASPESVGSCRTELGDCPVHGDEVSRMHASHLAEVVSLRRKIEALEHALAHSEAARDAATSATMQPNVTSIQLPSDHHRRRSDVAPAVTPIGSAARHVGLTAPSVETPTPVTSTPTGSAAWNDDDATFAERMAAKAFFREDDIDQRSRDWLLADG